jgi:hypothetical protein
MDDIAGTGAWVWGVEVIIGIQRVGHGRALLHFWADRAGDLEADEPWSLTFDRERGYTRDLPQQRADRSRDRIEAVLAASGNGGLTAEDIAAMSGLSERTVKRFLPLIGAAAVGRDRTGRKLWQLRSDGGAEGAE